MRGGVGGTDAAAPESHRAKNQTIDPNQNTAVGNLK